jgi:DNA-binding PadR family transcriptional regulator
MDIKLSRRQQEVLNKLLDLYYEGGEPIHYITLAKHLGVGGVSAYEMLRLLEKHGLVEAEYLRSDGSSGPGRSMVVFRPTLSAARRLRQLAGKDFRSQEEWEEVKNRILQQIQKYHDKDYEALMDELLEQVQDQPGSLPHLAGIATAILINLKYLDAKDEVKNLKKALAQKGLSGVASLSALIGLGLNLSISKRLYSRLESLLLNRTGQILSAIAILNTEAVSRLRSLLREVANNL